MTCTREALATKAAHQITAVETMAVLDQIRELRGAPHFRQLDNRSEFIADDLRDWCKEQKIQANYCNPGSTLSERQQTVVSNHSTRNSETIFSPAKC